MKQKLLSLLFVIVASIGIAFAATTLEPGSKVLYNAVAAASAGDVLILTDGVYEEPEVVDLNKNITIKAADGAKPVIAQQYYMKLLNGAQATFIGIKFDGGLYKNGQGAYDHCIRPYDDSANKTLTLINCEFCNWKSYILFPQRANRCMQTMTLQGCYFHDNQRGAIYVETGSSDPCPLAELNIENTTFNGTPTYKPVDLKNGGTAVADAKLRIDHCTFYNCGPVRSEQSTDVVISNSIFAAPEATYAATICYGGEIKNCLVYNVNAHQAGPTVTGEIAADPKFEDAANGSFYLADDSPARHAGTDGKTLGDQRWWKKYTIDGIAYNLNETELIAEVTSGDGSYSGSVIIPSRITHDAKTYSVTSIRSSAFQGCSGLTSITIPNSVTSIGDWAFQGCSSLTSPVYNSHVFAYMPTSFSGTYTILDGIESIVVGAFSGCSSLTSVTIPNSVISIGSSAFQGCSGLTSITIPSSVTSIGSNAFTGCSNITSVTWNAKNCNTWNFGSQVESFVFGDEVEVIPATLCNGMNKLATMAIPESVTSIGNNAFEGCSNITSVTWNAKNCNTWNFGSQVESFVFGDEVEVIPATICNGMNKLASMAIPESVTSVGNNAFEGCSSVTSIVWYAKNCRDFSSVPFTSAVTSFTFGDAVARIPAYLCSGMNKLTTIIIPNSVTTIGNSTFYGCSNLLNVIIPNSVTSIGDNAFEGCSNLETLSIGSSMELIGSKAFGGCERIIDIYSYAERVPTVQTSTFDGVSRKAYLWVPANRVRNYKTHEIWGEFDVQAIEADGVNTSTVKIVPSDNSAKIIWPAIEDADTYEIIIYDQNGNIVCKLVFDSEGLLQSIAFGAPSRYNTNEAVQATGFRFEVTGLNAGTKYNYTIATKDATETVLDTKEGSFTTTGGIVTSVDNTSLDTKPVKILRNGEVLILRGDKTYTVQGQEVR